MRMESKRDCAIVQDLLPTYVDGLTKRETTSFVDAHLTDCEACRRICRAMSGALPPEAVQAEEIVQRLRAAHSRRIAIRWGVAAAVLLILAVCLLPMPRRIDVTNQAILWRCGTPEEVQSTAVTVTGTYYDYLLRQDDFSGSIRVEACPETHGEVSIVALDGGRYSIRYVTQAAPMKMFGSMYVQKDGAIMILIDEDGHWDGSTGKMLTAPAITREEAVALANELADELSPTWLGPWNFD